MVVREYTTPPKKTLSRDLTVRVNHIVQFLIDCRPMSVSMGNAIRWLKLQIAATTQLALPESEVKATLVEDIDNFIQEKIIFADRVRVSALYGPLGLKPYGCPLVYKSGWIGSLSAGLAPTINTRGALGGLAERPAVLDAPR